MWGAPQTKVRMLTKLLSRKDKTRSGLCWIRLSQFAGWIEISVHIDEEKIGNAVASSERGTSIILSEAIAMERAPVKPGPFLRQTLRAKPRRTLPPPDLRHRNPERLHPVPAPRGRAFAPRRRGWTTR